MRSIRIMSVALACLVAACAKSDKSADRTDSANASASASAGTGATAAGGMAASGCVEGTWKKQDGTFTQTIVFNADKTGEEIHSRDDKRTFKWTVKNDTIVEIAYTTAGSAKSDWNVTVDCRNNRLTNGFSK